MHEKVQMNTVFFSQYWMENLDDPPEKGSCFPPFVIR